MKKHVHKWKRTGNCDYSNPLQYEYKCKCGKTRWVDETSGIKQISLTEEEFRAKYPQYFKGNT